MSISVTLHYNGFKTNSYEENPQGPSVVPFHERLIDLVFEMEAMMADAQVVLESKGW